MQRQDTPPHKTSPGPTFTAFRQAVRRRGRGVGRQRPAGRGGLCRRCLRGHAMDVLRHPALHGQGQGQGQGEGRGKG